MGSPYKMVEWMDSHDVRKFLPEVGFERDERILHLKRVSFLIKTMEKSIVSVIAYSLLMNLPER